MRASTQEAAANSSTASPYFYYQVVFVESSTEARQFVYRCNERLETFIGSLRSSYPTIPVVASSDLSEMAESQPGTALLSTASSGCGCGCGCY